MHHPLNPMPASTPSQEMPVSGGEIDRARPRSIANESSAEVHLLNRIRQLETSLLVANGVTHDVNNLLHAILGSAELAALEMVHSVTTARQMLNIVATSATRAGELCRQFMDFAGAEPTEPQVVAVNQLLEELPNLLGGLVRKSAIIECNLSPLPLRVRGYPVRLRQVFMNLVVNAAEAMGNRQGYVTLASGLIDAEADYLAAFRPAENLAPGPYIFVDVADNGVGMPPEVREQIFEPFFTTKKQGRGLGLAVMLDTVREHAGGIKVESEVGLGTSFRLIFPAVTAPSCGPLPGANLPETRVTS